MNVSQWLDKHAGWIIAGGVAIAGLIGWALQRAFIWLSEFITARHKRKTDHEMLESLEKRITKLEQVDHQLEIILTEIRADLKWIKERFERERN